MRPSFEVRLQPAAAEQLQVLDPEVRRRVRDKLVWLAEHAEAINHIPLRRDLAGLWKRRVGSYRIIYQVVRTGRILVVHKIGHRRDVYDLD